MERTNTKYWDRICSEEVPKLLKAAMYHLSLEITPKLEESVGHRMSLTMRATLNSSQGALAVTKL